MNAIILSRDDADRLWERDFEGGWIERLLKNGTPGLSWLQLVPEDDLHRLACAMGWQYDQGGADQHDDRMERQISEEILRREQNPADS